MLILKDVFWYFIYLHLNQRINECFQNEVNVIICRKQK